MPNEETVTQAQTAPQGVQQTKDYSIFRIILGNRTIDERHVATLARKIEKEGNLTQWFPIIVNENMEVIDGQHRLRALEQLGQPVFYEVKQGLNVGSVISLNTGNRNWGWRDYAMSYSDRGNTHYKQLLELYDEFNERYRVLMAYTGNSTMGSSGRAQLTQDFYNGDFVIKDFALARRLLAQYHELAEASNINTREFALAAYRFMRTPTYDHQAMLSKIAQYGEDLNRCYTISDYLFSLERIWRAQ